MEGPNPLDPVDPNIPRRSPQRPKTDERPRLASVPSIDSAPADISLSPLPTDGALLAAHSGRPALAGQSSFQRSRKRVLWRNKPCYITLPPKDKDGQVTRRTDYLNAEEVAKRLQRWADDGYNIGGFVLSTDFLDENSTSTQSQTCSVYPDQIDQFVESRQKPYTVYIPDKSQWDEKVNSLKEEKLRALGVTFSDAETQPRRSPVPSLMSRQASSQSSAAVQSPPLAATSLPVQPYGAPFPLNQGQIGKSGVSHFPRFSVAMPMSEMGFAHPQQHPFSRSPIHRNISPMGPLSSQVNSRVSSPSIAEHLAKFPHPSIMAQTPPPQNTGPGRPQVPVSDSDQSDTSISKQTSASVSKATLPHRDSSLIHEADLPLASRSQDTLNIATPVPRSHRQNPSESLQREVEEAEAYLEQLDGKRDPEGGTKLPVEQPRSSSRPDYDHTQSPVQTTQPRTSSISVLSAHGSKSSISSKLNVNAPEFKFEPSSVFTKDSFAFTPDQHVGSQNGTSLASQHSAGALHARKMSQIRTFPRLNAAAPTFTPSTTVPSATAPSRVFSFGQTSGLFNEQQSHGANSSNEFRFSAKAPSFNPDAPEFKPSENQTPEANESATEAPRKDKIFGNFSLVNVVKPSKESKALPIMPPQPCNELDSEPDGLEDESGRITQTDARQKRMRRDKDDGDQVPQFAAPSEDSGLAQVFKSRATLSPPVTSQHRSNNKSLEAATNLLEEIVEDMSPSGSSATMAEAESVRLSRASERSLSSQSPLVGVSKQGRSTKRPQFEIVPPAAGRSSSSTRSVSRSVSSSYSETQSEGRSYRRHREGNRRPPHVRQEVLDGVRYLEPSLDEIDDVMKHLNAEDDSDIGIVREASPWRANSLGVERGRSPREELTKVVARQLLAPARIRSDAPSPSPNRLREPFQYLPHIDTDSDKGREARFVEENARFSPSHRPSKHSPPIYQLNSRGSSPPSDWNDGFSSVDEAALRSKSTFFDQKMYDVVGSIMNRRLQPLEKIMSTMQESLLRRPRSAPHRRISGLSRDSTGPDIVDSDADDEDDAEDAAQAKQKLLGKDRKYEQLKSTINEIALNQQRSISVDQFQEIVNATKDLKTIVAQGPSSTKLMSDIKPLLEDALTRQTRGKSIPVVSSSQAAAAERNQLQITGLESMLKIAEGRAEDEMKARRATEDALADNQRLLRQSMQEVAQQRESVEATEAKLHEFHEERQDHLRQIASLEGGQDASTNITSELSERCKALEITLDEYRVSHDQWRTSLDDVKHEKRSIEKDVHSLQAELKAAHEDKDHIKSRLFKIRDEVTLHSNEAASHNSRWLKRSEQHKEKLDLLNARLEAEARTRERLEQELERLENQEKESMKSRFQVEQTQKVNGHLDKLVSQLRQENQEQQNALTDAQRENYITKERASVDAHRTRSIAETDVKAARDQTRMLQTEMQAIIDQLTLKLESSIENAANVKSNHDNTLQRTIDTHQAAMRQAMESFGSTDKRRTQLHGREVEQVKAETQQKIENLIEEKYRLQSHLGDRLQLADEKNTHFQDRIGHLEDKLEVAKSAAHAAVQAAQASKNGITEVAVSETSINAGPVKVSPQALRESILVLQEQLQAREGAIEVLESKLAAIDHKAPEKLKDAELEISWLRELLSVRVDDLQDIIHTVSQPSFSQEAIKDAAIRLKTNLQMEQQEKDRAILGGRINTSFANITHLTATPKALPMAAAAAWSNWRKRTGSVLEAAGASASRRNQQTPSKTFASPSSSVSGLLTPPSTNVRSQLRVPKPRTISTSSDPLQAPSTPTQNVQSVDVPSYGRRTPPLMRKGSYDLDAAEAAVFGDEHQEGQESEATAVDESAFAIPDEPFGPRLGTVG